MKLAWDRKPVIWQTGILEGKPVTEIRLFRNKRLKFGAFYRMITGLSSCFTPRRLKEPVSGIFGKRHSLSREENIMGGLVKDLVRLVGRDSVKGDPEDLLVYQADATGYFAKGNPDAIVLPGTTEAVSKVVAYACDHHIPVTPRGAGSGLSGGCTPIRGGIVLDMKRMNRILDINKGNLTANAESGVVLADFHRAVIRQNLFYPPDPQSMTVCTLGGNVSTRAGGPHGVKYGTTGNYVLGLEVVLPDGSVIQTGGSCVKHSVGYDITHLMTGAEGTLGVITRVTVRLLPKPASDRTVIIVCASIQKAVETVSAIIARGIVPATLEYIPKRSISLMNRYITPPLEIEGEAFLFLKVDGSSVQITEESENIRQVCLDLGATHVKVIEDPREAASYWKARTAAYPLALSIMKKIIIEDVTVPRDKIPQFAESLKAIAAATGLIIGMSGHAGDGNLHPSISFLQLSDDMEEKTDAAIRKIIESGLDYGGCISGEHGIGLHKSAFIEMELGRRQIELFKDIKRAVDPAGIMNPGKIWVEEDQSC